MRYLSYPEAVGEHFALMWAHGETRHGVFDRSLIESALARPEQAAAYENANLYTQAPTLCFGLIKNHPWIGGNKRTATHLTDCFLQHNGYEIVCSDEDLLELVYAIEANEWDIARAAAWMQEHIQPYSPINDELID
jgi:death on curing protein